jgi:hypothetical protein
LLAPIQEESIDTERKGEDSEEEKPKILKNLRNHVSFPEKIYIL